MHDVGARPHFAQRTGFVEAVQLPPAAKASRWLQWRGHWLQTLWPSASDKPTLRPWAQPAQPGAQSAAEQWAWLGDVNP